MVKLDKTVIAGIEVELIRAGAGPEVRYETGASIDADGCPRAYALPSSGKRGLDNIHNALKNINDDTEHPEHGWVGVVCDSSGRPIVQQSGPTAGYLISTTALVDHGRNVVDPQRYVDSETIPYISVPPALLNMGVRLGDGALVASRDTGESVQCIVADVGPRKRLGEVSIACAKALGIPSSPRDGGAKRGVIVRIFCGSVPSPAWRAGRTAEDIARLVDARACLTTD